MKMLGLAAVAAAALMAFVGAGTASATTLTDEAGNVVNSGSTIDFSIPSGKSAVLVDTTGEELDKCTGSTARGKTSNGGGAGVAVTGNVETLTWTSCTLPTKTLAAAGLQVNGTGAGNVSATGTFEVEIETIFFGPCVYGVTNGTPIGTLANGTFTANAVTEKFSGNKFACLPSAVWTGTYTATEPKGLKVDA
jgi:hypothetical protein